MAVEWVLHWSFRLILFYCTYGAAVKSYRDLRHVFILLALRILLSKYKVIGTRL